MIHRRWRTTSVAAIGTNRAVCPSAASTASAIKVPIAAPSSGSEWVDSLNHAQAVTCTPLWATTLSSYGGPAFMGTALQQQDTSERTAATPRAGENVVSRRLPHSLRASGRRIAARPRLHGHILRVAGIEGLLAMRPFIVAVHCFPCSLAAA